MKVQVAPPVICPQDTDGDGRCWRPHCPYCGHTALAQEFRGALLVHGLMLVAGSLG